MGEKTENGFSLPDRLTFKRKEVVQIAKLEGRVLDFWEREFSVLHPVVNQGGEKFYTRQDVELILRIKKWLLVEKLTKERVKELLQAEGEGGPTAAPSPSRGGRDAANGPADDETLRRIKSGLREILTIMDKNDKK